jgi:hypothetical protein
VKWQLADSELKEEHMASICSNCAAPLEAETKFCGACGNAVDVRSISSENHGLRAAIRDRRYPGLRIIAFILKIFAVLTAIGGVITGLSAASITSSLPNYPGIVSPGIGAAGSAIGWIIFLAGLCYALFLWASAEMIHVLIDIEENTRCSAGFTAKA